MDKAETFQLADDLEEYCDHPSTDTCVFCRAGAVLRERALEDTATIFTNNPAVSVVIEPGTSAFDALAELSAAFNSSSDYLTHRDLHEMQRERRTDELRKLFGIAFDHDDGDVI